MDRFTDKFNDILIEAYHNVLLMEETKRRDSRASLSFRDRNVLEYLYRMPEGEHISRLADYLKVSRPSATTIMKKLEALGFITRKTDPRDERNTIACITRKGRLMAVYQKNYRIRLAQRVGGSLSEEEKEGLYKGLESLNDFFKENIEELGKK